ncbi:MAG: UvrD-helicase domain-containing protein [Flammeovirgaceae bacterium]
MAKLFKIYRSSAGSGKTFTLTKEYLKLALVAPYSKEEFNPFYFKHILAITFTNFAANEMKERILNALQEIAKQKETNILQAIIEETKNEYPDLKIDKKTFFERAKMMHEALLHHYTDFSVSTIDAFSQKIVQSFRKELNLPYHYSIELDTDEILDEAIDLMQQKIGKGDEFDNKLSEIMIDFAINQAEDNKSWFIEGSLKKFGKNLFNEERYDIIHRLNIKSIDEFKNIKNEVFDYLKSIEKAVVSIAQNAINIIHQQGLTEKDFFQGERGIYGFFKKHTNKDEFEKIFLDKIGSYALNSVENDNWAAPKGNISKINYIKNQLYNYFYEIKNYKENQKEKYILALELKKNIYQLATIYEIEQSLQSIKDDQNLVHINDINHKINKIVETEPVPFIFEKLGIRYHHILIDEFQDTSIKQWHNLIPLVINSLNKQCLNLVVGDAKQSIYRWRGGKADMLVNLPLVPTLNPNTQLFQDANILKREENVLHLNINRRSKNNIIHFNNDFYTTIKELKSKEFPDVENFYKEVKQETTHKAGGQVEFVIFDEKTEKNEYFNAVLAKIIDFIEEMITIGYQKNNIAILVRKNDDGFQIAKGLMENGYSVVSTEVLKLISAPSIDFLMQFFKLIAGSKDQKVKMNLITYIIHQLEKITHKPPLKTTGEMLIEATNYIQNEEENTIIDYINTLCHTPFDLDGMRFLSIYEIAEEIIRQLNLHQIEGEQMYLHKFLDEIQNFVVKKGNHLINFIEYIEQNADNISIASPTSPDSINLMTIHKSKGLQFPVVIIPFAEWQFTPYVWEKMWCKTEENFLDKNFGLNASILTIKKDIQNTSFKDEYFQEIQATFLDALNILYVATTRAENRLLILSKEPKNNNNTVFEFINSYLETIKSNRPDEFNKIFSTKQILINNNQPVDYSYYKLFEDSAEEILQIKQTNDEENIKIKEFLHTESRTQIKLKRNSLRNDEVMLNLSSVLSAKRQGLLMHYAFEKVLYESDVNDAVQSLLREGFISVEEATEIENKMLEVISLPVLNPFYKRKENRKVLNEHFILLPKNERNISSLRPDRLVIDKYDNRNEVVIIDYKTGAEEDIYKIKINHYAYILQNMGYVVKKKLLVYTETLNIVEV